MLTAFLQKYASLSRARLLAERDIARELLASAISKLTIGAIWAVPLMTIYGIYIFGLNVLHIKLGGLWHLLPLLGVSMIVEGIYLRFNMMTQERP